MSVEHVIVEKKGPQWNLELSQFCDLRFENKMLKQNMDLEAYFNLNVTDYYIITVYFNFNNSRLSLNRFNLKTMY